MRAGGQARYEDLIENMNDIIYSADREGNLLTINLAVKRILGFDPQEMIGTHYSRWMPKEEFDRLEAARPGTLQGGRVTHQVLLRDKEGNGHFVEFSVSPLVVDGHIEGTQGIIRDVTQQRKAEQAVRESEERLRSLFNATTESIFLLDRQGTFLTLNETTARRTRQERRRPDRHETGRSWRGCFPRVRRRAPHEGDERGVSHEAAGPVRG